MLRVNPKTGSSEGALTIVVAIPDVERSGFRALFRAKPKDVPAGLKVPWVWQRLRWQRIG